MTSVLGDSVVESSVTTKDGASVAWTTQGTGDAVLLAQGFAFTKEMWFRVARGLSERYRVITFDNRGVGRTRAPNMRFTLRTLADDAMAVLDAAGVDRAHIYGASMGGGTAVEIALNYPERVRSLILGCTTAKAEVTEPGFKLTPLHRILPTRLFARMVSGKGFYGAAVDPARVREDLAVLRSGRFTWEGLAGQSQAVAEYTCADRVDQIKVPTLVIHGTEDKTVPFQLGELLAASIPGARLVVVEGAGHVYPTDNPELATQAVLDFLAAVRP